LRKLERTVHEHAPGVVYVALGSPKQEILIRHLRRSLPSVWWMGVGISFSYLTEDVRRAPHWLQVSGFEWLHRLLHEPRRLFRRYVVDGVPFALRLFWDSACRRLDSPVGT
jgi:N-acetylglucosaminyldiphosphoundecaprenol N-acetyl-beta-D-mannosaminyltransferase